MKAGTVSGKKVLIQLGEPWKPNAGSLEKRMNCGIIVTTPGSIMVASTTEKSLSRPGQRNRANEYATMDVESTEPMTEKKVITTVFIVQRPQEPKLNAVR